jgi:hypothetical protein
MTPMFKVTVARRCEPRVKALRGDAKKASSVLRSFAIVDARPAERACAPRRATPNHVCERRFYRDWRMHLVFGDQNEIVISWVGRHTQDEAVHVDGARDIPGLSGIGRARDLQPQCCETLDDPPADPDLVALVNQIRPTRSRHPRDRTT